MFHTTQLGAQYIECVDFAKHGHRAAYNQEWEQMLIQTIEQLNEFIDLYRKQTYAVVDTETTGLDVWGNDTITGISVYLPAVDMSVYIPVGHGEGRFTPLSADDVADMTWRKKDKKLVLTDQLYSQQFKADVVAANIKVTNFS